MKSHPLPRPHRRPPPPELPPLAWETPQGVPPLKITKAPESPGWADTLPIDLALPLEHDAEHGPAFEESLTGLHVRELIGAGLFERLFGPRPPAPPR